MGWLEKLTSWLKETIAAIFDALLAFVHDLAVWVFKAACDLSVWIVTQLGVPDFMTDYNLQGLFNAMGSTAGWVLSTFRIPECFGILAAGLGFRLLRKLFTLGQW